ncbi:hypothetical protein BD414DRAFT_538591 [Trametes punicea]|nr:hypothetical protein BD414DRAFT_538591 [Trametes punicea]
MLHILRRIEAPYLDHLELEFEADGSDNELFRYIGTAYLRLTALRVHRYRALGEAEVPLDRITTTLSPLSNLRLLMLHLDFADLPDVDAFHRKYDYDLSIMLRHDEQVRTSQATLEHTAKVFARLLSPSLEHTYLLLPLRKQIQQWVPFRIVRSAGREAGSTVSAERLPIPSYDFNAFYGYR